MQASTMQTSFSPADAAQVIAMKTLRDSKTEPLSFSCNNDHLQALETEAKFMVAVAALRRGKSPTDDPSEQPPCFAFLKDGADLDQAALSLATISAENRRREQLSRNQGVSLNFLEFCDKWELDPIERMIVLLLLMQFSSPTFFAVYQSSGLERNCDNGMEIGAILSIITGDLGLQLEYRRYFSIHGKLLRNEVLTSNYQFMDNTSSILRMSAYLHERYVRHIVGDTNQYHVAFRFIKHERSNVDLEQVVLPDDLKREVIMRAERFIAGRRNGTFDQLDDFFSYGTGLAFIFHGPSGTGKTMLAKGLANHLSCPLVSLNAEDLSNIPMSNNEIMETLFREAALIDGIVFLDECDDIFGGSSNSQLSRSLLLEIEKSRCITILATNKPVELDPAMERRIGMKVQFALPDAGLRLQMWEALIPPSIALNPDVNLNDLAERYKFNGGLIKNSILMAIAAADRDGDSRIILTQKDLERASELQTSTMSELNRICSTVNPGLSLDNLPLGRKQKDELRGLSQAWAWLSSQDLGFNLLFNCNDVDTGINAVLGLAAECRMTVHMYDFTKVSSMSEDAKLLDPITQRRVSPMTAVFSNASSEKVMTLFVDHGGELGRIIDRDTDKDKLTDIAYAEMFSQMRKNKGMFCVVTKDIKAGCIPIEFHQMITLEYPSEEQQMRCWEACLGEGIIDDDLLVDIVRQYPMHAEEIRFIARQATVRTIMQSSSCVPDMKCILDVVSGYRKKIAAPVLFGAA